MDLRKRGLSMLFWTWAAKLAVTVVYTVLSTLLLARFREGAGNIDFEATMSLLRTLDGAASVIHVLVGSMIVAALATLVRGGKTAAPFFTLALVCAVIEVASSLLWVYGAVTEKALLPENLDLLRYRVFLVADVIAMAAIVGGLFRVAKDRGGDGSLALGIPAAVCAAISGFVFLALTFDPQMFEFRSESPWMWRTLMLALTAGMYGFGLGMIRQVTSVVDEGSRLSDVECWQRAASGLSLFASALHARVWIALVGVVLLMCAAFAGSMGMIKVFTVSLPLASTITAGVMFWGLLGFRIAPQPTSVDRTVGVALVIFALAFFVELISTLQVLDVLQNSRPHVDDSSRVNFDTAVQVMVLIGFVMVLSCMMRIADHLGVSEFAQKAAGLYLLIIFVFGLAAVLRYAIMKGELVHSMGTAALLLIGASIATLVAIAKYAGAAHEIAYIMRDRAELGGAPAQAIVVRTDDAE